jgi:hypothetical protein
MLSFCKRENKTQKFHLATLKNLLEVQENFILISPKNKPNHKKSRKPQLIFSHLQYLKQDKMNVSNISLLMGSYFCIQDIIEVTQC